MISFYKAARRHFQDADYLRAAQRTANASHLFGLHAECGLKALLVGLGEPVNPNTGDLERQSKAKEHINVLLALVATLPIIMSRRDSPKYLAMVPTLNSFSSWKVEHRYWDSAAIPLNDFDAWYTASIEVELMLDQALIDGVIR